MKSNKDKKIKNGDECQIKFHNTLLDLSLEIIVIIAKVNGLNYVVCYKKYLIKSCLHEKHKT